MTLANKMLPITDNVIRKNGYALGWVRGAYWIGVVFGKEWKVARLAHEGDLKQFGVRA